MALLLRPCDMIQIYMHRGWKLPSAFAPPMPKYVQEYVKSHLFLIAIFTCLKGRREGSRSFDASNDIRDTNPILRIPNIFLPTPTWRRQLL